MIHSFFQDDRGLWRCGGRLLNAEVSFSVKHPILLPKTHPLTTLIVTEAHQRVFHNGVKETLVETRRRFWVLKGRSLTRWLHHRCVLCRQFEGAPFKTPPPPPLPGFQPSLIQALTLLVPSVSKPHHKVWICLYMCFVTRAVHLDAVPDMSTQTFILFLTARPSSVLLSICMSEQFSVTLL